MLTVSFLLIRYYIGREDKLNNSNRSVVNNYQVELGKQINSICNFVEKSLSTQKGNIECVEKLCQTFLDAHDKVIYMNITDHFLILPRFIIFCFFLNELVYDELIPAFSGCY